MRGPLSTALCAFAFLGTLIACEVIRRFAMRRALLDEPNDRSLHSVPTPRLGGVAIVLAVVIAAPAALHGGDSVAVLVGASAIALVGLIDDVRPLAASTRFKVQILGAAAFVWAVGVPPLALLPGAAWDAPEWFVAALLVVWIVGVLNIYNFMDGMDGLAGTQAVSAAAAQAILLGSAGAADLSSLSALLGAASGGFLLQNFPPARLFMGDAGSTFVGFTFASLGVLGMHHGVPLAAMALPLAPFLLDGTFTILRRALRREPVWRAHRSHLYQRAVQTGLGHREVLLVYAGWLALAFGAATLLPLSLAATMGGWAAAIAALLGVWAWVTRRESQKT